MKRLWRVGIVQNAVFFRSCAASSARKVSSQKRDLRRIGYADVAKICTKSQSLKTGMFGRLFEVGVSKTCAPLWRESGLELKTVKAPGSRTIFKVQSAFPVVGAGLSAQRPHKNR